MHSASSHLRSGNLSYHKINRVKKKERFIHGWRAWGEKRLQVRRQMHWCDDIKRTIGVQYMEAA